MTNAWMLNPGVSQVAILVEEELELWRVLLLVELQQLELMEAIFNSLVISKGIKHTEKHLKW